MTAQLLWNAQKIWINHSVGIRVRANIILTHWDRNNMAAILNFPFWNVFSWMKMSESYLTHWGRVTHICVSDLTIIGSDNGLSPGRRQVIIWTNAGLLSIEPLRTYFSENLIKIQPFSLKKMHVKMLSAKWRPSCLGLNVLRFHLLLFPRFELTLSQHWFR